MQRAVVLILVMLVLGIGMGLWMEASLQTVCADYGHRLQQVRRLVEAEVWQEALQLHAYLYASWQGEVQRLNAMVSHHHTRAVEEALLSLTTALEEGWHKESLLALDDAAFALNDLVMDMTLRWENVL